MSEEASKRPAFMEMVDAFKVLDVAAREGKPHEVEVQVIALGKQLAWVSLPGEVFTELGLAIKQDSPFPTTIIAELANGLLGYIPSRRAYAQGNYEVVSARCAEGSGERLVDAAVKMLKELHAEKPVGPMLLIFSADTVAGQDNPTHPPSVLRIRSSTSGTRRPETNWPASMNRLSDKLKTSTCQSFVCRLRMNGGSNPIGTNATMLPTKLMTNIQPP